MAGPVGGEGQGLPEIPSRAQRIIGDVAPKLVELTDEVLFGDVWRRPELSPRDRSLITVAALVALYRGDQLRFHFERALANGVTQAELVEAVTHLAFYAGWPTASSAITILKDVLAAVPEGESPERLVRRVVVGVDPEGRSTVLSDGPVTAHAQRPDGSLVMDVWRCDQLPPHVDDQDGLAGTVAAPATGGLVHRLCWFPPNTDMDADDYARAMAQEYGDDAVRGGAAALRGGHRTDTVDVVTVVSGELHVLLETGEVLLRPGDSVVQRGTVHAWHNRSDVPALVVAVMMAARR